MIRLARTEDLDTIMHIFDCAKQYMKEQGNGNQWIGGYPSRALLEQDIEKKQCYVCVRDEKVHGIFVFIIGEDPTYTTIYDGEWLNDKLYGTIHRIASDGQEKGIFKECLDFCKSQIDNIRADTHENNKTMQHLMEKNGFKKCGIIHLADGRLRLAYHFQMK